MVLPGGISINPLNWKRDETYAPASENKGSLRPNKETGEYEIQHLDIDAQVNLARGVIVTTTTIPPSADPPSTYWAHSLLRYFCQFAPDFLQTNNKVRAK